MRVFTCQQCEYSSSGSDVSVNAVIIPQNLGAIPFFGASPPRRYCPPILRNDDRIHRYILPRTTVFPQYHLGFASVLYQCFTIFSNIMSNQLTWAAQKWKSKRTTEAKFFMKMDDLKRFWVIFLFWLTIKYFISKLWLQGAICWLGQRVLNRWRKNWIFRCPLKA